MDERLLELYNTELRHVRETAAEFARDFPKIAGRLSLDRDAKEACPDPYVERLLEGFAFLAARVHLKLDAEFPRFTQGLLETVYPDYLCPVPSMAVVQFEVDAKEASLSPDVVIKRKTLMRSLLSKGERTPCTFSTAHEVRLLPLEIIEARYFTRDIAELDLPAGVGARAALRLCLRKTIELPFKEIKADSLVFYLHGADELPDQLFEQIFGHKLKLIAQTHTERATTLAVLPADCIRRVGFATEQALLPPSPRGFEGYRLLREYFAFPQRFRFFELAGFQEALRGVAENEFDLVVALDSAESRLEGKVNRSCFQLHCAPVINLFPKTLDRIHISNRFSEFHIVPDRNRQLDFEIYQVESVTGFGETPSDEQAFLPFYHAHDANSEARAFYALSRVPRLFGEREQRTGRRSSYAGTDVFISIVDADMAPYRPDLKQLGVSAMCTNRHLPIQMVKGVGRTDLALDISAPVAAIRIITGPTVPRASLVLAGQDPNRPQVPSGRFVWRLVSHLSLNHFSIADTDSETGAEGLREVLRLYVDREDRQALKQIDGVRSIQHRPTTRHVKTPGPITFARGLEITVLFDEAAFEGQGVFVLGAVLEQFFARYVALNSFVETVIATQQRREIMRWPIRLGSRQIL